MVAPKHLPAATNRGDLLAGERHRVMVTRASSVPRVLLVSGRLEVLASKDVGVVVDVRIVSGHV